MSDQDENDLPVGEAGETVEVRTGNDGKRRAVLVTTEQKEEEQAEIIAHLEQAGLYDKKMVILGQEVRVPFRRNGKKSAGDPFQIKPKEGKS